MSEVPKNIGLIWHRGDFRFGQIDSWDMKHGYRTGKPTLEAYLSEKKGDTLNDAVFLNLFTRAILLAKQNPKRHYQYTRYDSREDAENENNKVFDFGDNKVKTMKMGDYTVVQDISNNRLY